MFYRIRLVNTSARRLVSIRLGSGRLRPNLDRNPSTPTGGGIVLRYFGKGDDVRVRAKGRFLVFVFGEVVERRACGTMVGRNVTAHSKQTRVKRLIRCSIK